LLKSAAGRLGLGAPSPTVSGLTPPAAALYAAVSGARGRTLLVVPTDALVESITTDARFFLCALEGWSSAEADRAVLPFPSHEVDPYRGLAPHLDIASARAHALDELVHGHARLVVASAAALLPRLSPPDRLAATSVTLTPGQEISPIALGDLLAEAGYTRQDPVDQSGEFCVRGGVVDFFPPGAPQPLRLEFVGDTIESIRPYDPRRSARSARSTRRLLHPSRSCSATTGSRTAPLRSSTTSGQARRRRYCCGSPRR
jgi:transcription-repair coupling factor (superfamily II helicase)